MDRFVAIDFEMLHPAHESACAVGMVKLVDGFVTARFFSLIRPPDEVCVGRINTDIHGISKEMLSDAPTFPEVFPTIDLLMRDATPLAHNATVERCCIDKCCRYFGMDVPIWLDEFVDTYRLTGKKLVQCCSDYGIPVDHHHDPLQDAWMCAQVFLSLSGQPLKNLETHERKNGRCFRFPNKPKYNPDDLVPLPSDSIVCKNTPFFNKHVLYTGTFERFPNRCDIGHQLKLLGAIVDREWAARTEILLSGQNPGPRKMGKASMKGIPIITEQDFYSILDTIPAMQFFTS